MIRHYGFWVVYFFNIIALIAIAGLPVKDVEQEKLKREKRE